MPEAAVQRAIVQVKAALGHASAPLSRADYIRMLSELIAVLEVRRKSMGEGVEDEEA